jgi:nucleotide-binding universal stress UspA family protein
MIRDVRTDQVLVVLHSVLSDGGVISAAEQLVAGDAQLRFLRVVPRAVPFTMSMFRQPPQTGGTGGGGLPVRLVAAGDDMATTILDLTRELNITLLALGEPPGELGRAELVRRVLSRILASSSAPVLFVPAGAKESRDTIRRILLVLHLPYPAMDLVDLALPLVRRTHAELMILTLPSATPFIPDAPALGSAPSSLVFRPFDAGLWLERECARHGFRTRPVSADGKGAKVILERAADLDADLVVADAGLADLRVGWRRRKVLDQLFPRFPCPLLLGRSA